MTTNNEERKLLGARATPDIIEQIDKAANKQHQSRSGFVVSAAEAKAKEVLDDEDTTSN